MKHTLCFAFAAALMGAPLTVAAQVQTPREAGARARADGMQKHNRSFERLIAHRAELNLTQDQVARLQGIAAQLEARNRPLREQLMQQHQQFMAQRRTQMERLSREQRRDTLRAMRARGRGHREVPATMRPLIEQMRTNQRAAAGEAQQVLTTEQKTRARELIQETRNERRGARGERGGRRGGRDGSDGNRRRGGRMGGARP